MKFSQQAYMHTSLHSLVHGMFVILVIWLLCVYSGVVSLILGLLTNFCMIILSRVITPDKGFSSVKL